MSLSSDLLHPLRSRLGRFFFSHVCVPPEFDGELMRPAPGDYGHACHYDEIFSGDGFDVEAAQWLCRDIEGPILDAGGGTGRLSRRLSELGREVTLVDLSNTMLEEASEKKRHMGMAAATRFEIVCEDLAALKLPAHYEAVFSLNNSLAHLSDREAIEAAVSALYRALLPGGWFFLDVHHEAYWKRQEDWCANEWGYLADLDLADGRTRIWRRTSRGTEPGQVIWEHALSRDLISFTRLESPIHVLSVSEWINLLGAPGFHLVKISGDWSGEPLSPSYPNVVFHLRKS